ncbi:MAG: hypothetical protein LBT10_04395 [Methanobrevibacter sp.]|nr:hypothetical protein [Methanobrevibacter sp.]
MKFRGFDCSLAFFTASTMSCVIQILHELLKSINGYLIWFEVIDLLII